MKQRDPSVLPGPVHAVVDPPALLEYRTVSGERWRVERFTELAAEFGAEAVEASDWARWAMVFHSVAAGYARGWLVVRRLFGVAPVVPPQDADPADWRVWERGELAASLGVDGAKLQAELDAVRALHRKNCKPADERERPAAPLPEPKPSGPQQRMSFEADHDVLKEFGFSEKMFEMSWISDDGKTRERRDPEANRLERDWFVSRVREWARYLREPNAQAITRDALLNELYLRRLEADMGVMKPGTKEFRELSKEKEGLSKQFAAAVGRLEEMFPEMGGTAGKVTFRGTVSDLIRGYHEYRANGDTRLVDRIRTAAEIEVELRQSVQAPEPRYRLGLNVAIIEAIEGLHDPDWKPAFRHSDLKKLDAMGRAAVEMTRVQMNEPLVDLEKEQEYPELEEVDRARQG